MSATVLQLPTDAIEVHLPSLFPWQRMVDRHQARNKVVDCGRQAGKTTYAEHRGALSLVQGQDIGWFNPSFRNLMRTKRSLHRQLYSILHFTITWTSARALVLRQYV